MVLCSPTALSRDGVVSTVRWTKEGVGVEYHRTLITLPGIWTREFYRASKQSTIYAGGGVVRRRSGKGQEKQEILCPVPNKSQGLPHCDGLFSLSLSFPLSWITCALTSALFYLLMLPSLPHMQGKGNQLLFLERESIEESVGIFKPPHQV